MLAGSALLLLFTVLGVSLLLPGCAVGYLTRQSATHLHVLAAREPVDRALQKEALSDTWKAGIRTIQAARTFGVKSLGLPADDLYRTISLVHPDPMWIVTASPRDALQPVTWWFPVVGRVAYRGYYDRPDAQRFARRLRRKDLDVLIQASDAFSSLGWFADPIRPAMLGRSETSLINMVLHEAAHRVLYIKGQTDFNESFASFVGEEGTLAFLRQQQEDPHDANPLIQAFTDERQDAARFSRFIGEVVDDLKTLYAQPLRRDEKISRRERVFAAAQQRFAALAWRGNRFRWFREAGLDNAVILSLLRYEGRRDLFHHLLEICHGDLAAAIRRVSGLGWDQLSRRERRSTDPFSLLEQRLEESPDCPAVD